MKTKKEIQSNIVDRLSYEMIGMTRKKLLSIEENIRLQVESIDMFYALMKDGKNIKSALYDNTTHKWTIEYFEGVTDIVSSDNLFYCLKS